MTDALYTKCPLPPHPGHIRLLRLHPSSDPLAPLSGTIFATTFDASRASYEALSYCWGDDARPEIITLHVRNEEPRPGDSHTDQNTIPIQLPITRSLAEALADIRFPSSDRLLWADALCIDQAHNGEKSVQVRQMYDIYANSRRTLVYLGRAGAQDMQAAIAHRDYLRAVDAGSETLADSLQAADAGTLVTWDPAVGVVRAGKGEAARDCLDFRTTATLPDTKADLLFAHQPDIVNSWRCILECPWTTRAWTTQEFVAGPDVLMQLGQGEVTLRLDDLFNLSRYMGYYDLWGVSELSSAGGTGPKIGGPSGAYLPFLTTGIVARKVFWMIRLKLRVREWGEAMSIGHVLGLLRGISSTTVLNTRDARDVLWSLLALSRNRAVPELQPNYDLSVNEVYRRFSIHIATAEAFHSSMLLRVPLQMQAGTPSWRLSEAIEDSKSTRFYYEQRPRDRNGIWATANKQGTELTVSGALVDKIDRLVEPSDIDPQLIADEFCASLWAVTATYGMTQEAASWPGVFVLPDESPDGAAFKLFRGITQSWVTDGLFRNCPPVFNASWEQYAHLWFLAKLSCVSRTSPTLAGATSGKHSLTTPDDLNLTNFDFFKLVRSKGWPLDMVRHYLDPDDSEPSELPVPTHLTSKEACIAALDKFGLTAVAHCFKFLPYWQGKAAGMTSRGHLCNVDKEARVGDWIAMTAYHPTALVLRAGPGGAFSLVGQAYAHGLMEGMEMYGDVEDEIRLC